MKSLAKITNPKKVKKLISVFMIFFFANNLIAYGAENKSVLLKIESGENEFEETFFENSIPYSIYDNSESQLKVFFGRWRYSTRPGNIFYPDLSIIQNSDSLREIYKSKLNDMTIIDSKYNYDE